MPSTEEPTAAYISRFFFDMRQLFEGLHRRIRELEELRFGEEEIPVQPSKDAAGHRFRVRMLDDLIETAKAAALTQPPKIHIKPLRRGKSGDDNASKRENFWNAWLEKSWPFLVQMADNQFGLGISVFKMVYDPWPADERKQKEGESNRTYLNRLKGKKREWGVPFKPVLVHPLSFYFRWNPGDFDVLEGLEETYKNRYDIQTAYDVLPDIRDVAERIENVETATGFPPQDRRPIPFGVNLTTYVRVCEYWNPKWSKVYLGVGAGEGALPANEIHSEDDPGVAYFVAPGRLNGSLDPDKIAMSIGDHHRGIEPFINKMMSEMLNVAEIAAHPKGYVIVPEGGDPQVTIDEEGNVQRTVYEMSADGATGLPPGADLRDPYANSGMIWSGMPLLQMAMDLLQSKGPGPILRGLPPSSAGSGYRDNSLYLMAKSMFMYSLHLYTLPLAKAIRWMEQQIANRVQDECWIDDYHLGPGDIEDWPVEHNVELKPDLPQNKIQETQNLASLSDRGLIPESYVIEHGLGEEAPQELQDEVEAERIYKEYLRPILARDVLVTVGVLKPEDIQTSPAEEGGMVSDALGGEQPAPEGAMESMNGNGGGGSGGVQGLAALQAVRNAGVSRQPPRTPGTL